MIVEGAMLGYLAYKLFIAPTRALLTTAKVVELSMKPGTVIMQDADGNQISFPSADFYNEDGSCHTDHAVYGVLAKDGKEYEVVMSRSEIELLQFVSYVEDKLENNKEVPEVALREACNFVEERRDEVTRSPNRRVTRTSR
jgi:hypothetical protein